MSAHDAIAIRRTTLAALLMLALLVVPGAWAGTWSQTLTAGVGVQTASEFPGEGGPTASAAGCPDPAAPEASPDAATGGESDNPSTGTPPADDSQAGPGCEPADGVGSGEGHAHDGEGGDEEACRDGLHEGADGGDESGATGPENGGCDQEGAPDESGDAASDPAHDGDDSEGEDVSGVADRPETGEPGDGDEAGDGAPADQDEQDSSTAPADAGAGPGDEGNNDDSGDQGEPGTNDPDEGVGDDGGQPENGRGQSELG